MSKIKKKKLIEKESLRTPLLHTIGRIFKDHWCELLESDNGVYCKFKQKELQLDLNEVDSFLNKKVPDFRGLTNYLIEHTFKTRTS